MRPSTEMTRRRAIDPQGAVRSTRRGSIALVLIIGLGMLVPATGAAAGKLSRLRNSVRAERLDAIGVRGAWTGGRTIGLAWRPNAPRAAEDRALVPLVQAACAAREEVG